MEKTESFSLSVKDYCEYCPDFSAFSENIDITTLGDLPLHKAIHVIKCADADRCERVRAKMKAKMEAKREETEKVQGNVRGCENERPEDGADSDNGQSDGGETCIPDVRGKENQRYIIESNKRGWRESVMQHFLRSH